MNKLALIPFLFASVVAQASVPSALDVMKKNEAARRVTDTVADATLETKTGDKNTLKKFTWWRRLNPDAVHYNTLTRFRDPSEVRGEGILFLERNADENEVLMYLPSFKKTRRVESQAQSGSFMGSAFSYSDIATPHVDDYAYKMLREETCPDGSKVQCWVIEATPSSDAVKERIGATRVVQWIRQDCYMVARSESFDGDQAFKQMQASETKEVDPMKHTWMSHHLEMKDLKSNRATTLQFAAVKVNQGVAENTFTPQNLTKEH